MRGRHRRALGVLVAGAVALAGCGTPEPSASEQPPPTPTPSTAASSPPASAGPSVMELTAVSGELPPGRYTRSDFSPRVTFELDGPWHAAQIFDGFFDVQQDPGSPDVIAVQFALPEGVYGQDSRVMQPENAAAAVEALSANPRLEVIETGVVSMGGLDGQQITVENPSGESGDAPVIQVEPGALQISPGRRLQVAFFDIPDGLLAIMVGGSVERWDEALAVAEPVLESVQVDE